MADTLATAILLEHVQQGDKEALDQLYRRYQGRVLAAVRYRLGQKLRQKLESADIAQNVLMDALQKVESFEFRTEGAFLHYLNRLVENRIKDEARHWKADKRDIGKEQPLEGGRSDRDRNPLSVQDRGTPSPSHLASAQEDYRRLATAMDRLRVMNPKYQELIIAAKVEGLDYGEIAANLGKSRDAVRMQLNRALVELTKIYRGLEHSNG